ncbi:15424_t:CDS:2, partial [Funneliformis geosporum]
MSFSIFTGVNNYGCSICFADTLMIDETEDNFLWMMITQWQMLIQNFKTNGHKASFMSIASNKKDIQKFLTHWKLLKTLYCSALTYLLRMEKTKEKWVGCFNHDIFMVDMTTTQHGESMNNMMNGYLDAKELSISLFYERWRKNPSEKNLINTYTNFYSIATSTILSSQHLSLTFSNGSDDFQYMLTRLLHKIQQFVIQNPNIAKTLYTSINTIYNSEIEKINKIQTPSNLKVISTIKNPLVVHGKERSSNKRITSTMESTSKSNRKKKFNENNNRFTQNTQQLLENQSLNILPLQQFRCPSPPSTQFQFFSETEFIFNELNLEESQEKEKM